MSQISLNPLVLALIAISCIQLSYSVTHEFSVYSGPLGSGDGILLRNKYEELSRWRSFLDVARSYCFIGGPWAMFRSEHFIGALDQLPYSDIRRCYDRGFRDVQSLRYLGPANVSLEAISMYQGTSENYNSAWSGQEVIFEGPSAANLSFIPTGLIISGDAEWTAFTLPDFNGNATCFIGNHDVPIQVIARTPILSISKGCSNNTVHHF